MGKQCASEVPLQEIMHYLSALIYRPNFLIGSITITENFLHLSADTDMVADILCIPTSKSQPPFTAIINLEEPGQLFYITLIVLV